MFKMVMFMLGLLFLLMHSGRGADWSSKRLQQARCIRYRIATSSAYKLLNIRGGSQSVSDGQVSSAQENDDLLVRLKLPDGTVQRINIPVTGELRQLSSIIRKSMPLEVSKPSWGNESNWRISIE